MRGSQADVSYQPFIPLRILSTGRRWPVRPDEGFASRAEYLKPLIRPCGTPSPGGEGMKGRPDEGDSRAEVSISSPSSVPAGHLLPRGEGMKERRDE